tara:strand:+ start:552 stop:2891 length:2340 start_codon:yes stop_codon:yes gene_type:complete
MLKFLIGIIMLLGGFMSVSTAEIEPQLIQAFHDKGPDYQPRTNHFKADGQPRYINRLILEDSPYLNQHAHNPVDWYPWGVEAFAVAKAQNKPIFLSIGYSTCHWCHVMEEESFDNIAIAERMNASFINIKVDREQRPEIDALYMMAVQLMTGRGGWPMSSFLTSEGKTFWAGTYLSPTQFVRVLNGLDVAWHDDREAVEAQADEVAELVNKISMSKVQGTRIDDAVIELAINQTMQNFDALQGGFTSAPKFPNESTLLLLIDAIKRQGDETLLAALVTTLDAMAQGGFYDQVGGGFHRYSTDDAWLVPHFEKMLYNQAQLARVYLQAYELTKNPFYARIAEHTLDYVLREMTSTQGGFYSATDADSEGEEGTFFVWTTAQLNSALSSQDAALIIDLFGVTEQGNFEGSNVLYLPLSLSDYSRQASITLPVLLTRLDAILDTLRQVRQQRVAPLRDDKILTAWNGMMVTTLVMANEILAKPKYLVAAERCADFIWQINRTIDNQMWRVHMRGNSSIPAVQEDYAYLAEAMIALYDANQGQKYINRSMLLVDEMIAQFWDEDVGGFYMDKVSTVPTMARMKQSIDGAMPSGNSVALKVLTQLAKRTSTLDYANKATVMRAVFAEDIVNNPRSYGYFLRAIRDQISGETGARQYAAQGAVTIHRQWTMSQDKIDFSLLITIADGWHINATKPLDKDLIATEVTLSDILVWELDKINYPNAIIKSLGFSQQPLALYEGTIEITGSLLAVDKPRSLPTFIELAIQACNEKTCLAPEKIKFRLLN